MRRILLQLTKSLFIFQLVACTGFSRSPVSTQDTNNIVTDSLAIRTTLEGWYTAMQEIDTAGVLARPDVGDLARPGYVRP